MNNLDLMLKRNKESAAPMPSLPQSLANFESSHHRLRRYAR